MPNESVNAAGDQFFNHWKSFVPAPIGQNWKEHLLHLDHLHQGLIYAFAQRDPLNEYKSGSIQFVFRYDGTYQILVFMLSIVWSRIIDEQTHIKDGWRTTAPKEEQALLTESNGLSQTMVQANTGNILQFAWFDEWLINNIVLMKLPCG